MLSTGLSGVVLIHCFSEQVNGGGVRGSGGGGGGDAPCTVSRDQRLISIISPQNDG